MSLFCWEIIIFLCLDFSGSRMVFGLNEKGYIFPLMIRLRLENGFGEFGVSAHLTKVNADKEYIFLSNEGNILDISENLYDFIFADTYPLSNKLRIVFCCLKYYSHQLISFNWRFLGQLRQLNIAYVIPLSSLLIQQAKFEEEFFSILIVKPLGVDSHK